MLPKTARILLVEDLPTALELLRKELEGSGLANIYEANGGGRALEMLLKQKELGEPIDIIISDWNMPNVTGLELLELIRTNPDFKNLPFIIVTNERDMAKVQEAVSFGVSSYITKPFQIDNVIDKMNRAWKKHRSNG